MPEKLAAENCRSETGIAARDANSNNHPEKPEKEGRLLGTQSRCGLSELDGGRDWDRTSDPYDVNVVLSR